MSGLVIQLFGRSLKVVSVNKKLVITLKSDLCVATGDGFSSSVDIDSCLDESGFPFIPGRRIKGCLRAAAVDIGCDNVDDIFGLPGMGLSGSIRVGNATLRNVDKLKREILQCEFLPTEVAALFTRMRAQTEIEGDTVKDGSLRFLRVVSHFSPIDAAELCFEASLYFDEKYERQIERAVKALRSIGYHRNRGLGAIKCMLVDAGEEEALCDYVRDFPGGFAYAVELVDPLMIPHRGDSSCSYIPGSSVYGFFASKLAEALPDERFEEMFLKGEVRFSPLYPVHQGRRTLPAFGLVAKVKGSLPGSRDGQFVNLLSSQLGEGEQSKPLKDGFVDSLLFTPVEVKSEITYHHTVNGDAALYTQECISAGQVFSGFVTGTDEALAEIKGVLERGFLSFGRSKTAQYSRCVLTECGEIPFLGEAVGDACGSVAAVLDSDVLLDNGCGGYSNNSADLLRAIADAAGPFYRGVRKEYCSINYRVISGYNAKWNQKKPHVRAFAAGSYCVFDSDGASGVPAEIFLGARQGEGFGRVVFIPVSSISPSLRKEDAALADVEPVNDSDGEIEGWRNLLIGVRERERLRAIALKHADEMPDFSASFVGRVLRMVEQSTNASELDSRLKSIKSDSKRLESQHIVERVRGRLGDVPWEYEQQALTVLFNDAKYRIKRAKGGS